MTQTRPKLYLIAGAMMTLAGVILATGVVSDLLRISWSSLPDHAWMVFPYYALVALVPLGLGCVFVWRSATIWGGADDGTLAEALAPARAPDPSRRASRPRTLPRPSTIGLVGLGVFVTACAATSAWGKSSLLPGVSHYQAFWFAVAALIALAFVFRRLTPALRAVAVVVMCLDAVIIVLRVDALGW